VGRKGVALRQILHHPVADRLRHFLFGSRAGYGLVFGVILYILLITIGFVYLYPLLFMFITSIKNPSPKFQRP
jgi:multiple sugar transport system permease protein